MIQIFLRAFFLSLFTFSFSLAEQLTDSFRLDGYGNMKMLKTDGRRDDFMLSGGFQGRYELNDNISITGQVHFNEGFNSKGQASNSLEDYDSELKWLYLDYYLKDDLTFRLGAFQFPVFKSSETGDIEYTFTWTETPLRFYGVFGCDDFEGVELLKNFSSDDFDFLAQLSLGKSNNTLSDGRGNSREGNVDNLVGLTLKTTHDNFILNAGYLQAESSMDTSNEFVKIEPDVEFNMFALESEIYISDYTLKSGFIKTNLSDVFPDSINYYTSLEYSYEDFTPYILYSKEMNKFKKAPDSGPDIKRLQSKEQSWERYSVGLRYDYNSNIAFKFSYSHEVDKVKYNGFDTDVNSNDTFMGTINVIF